MNPHSLGETDFKSAASTIPPLGHSSFIHTGVGGVNRENFEDAPWSLKMVQHWVRYFRMREDKIKILRNALHS